MIKLSLKTCFSPIMEEKHVKSRDYVIIFCTPGVLGVLEKYTEIKESVPGYKELLILLIISLSKTTAHKTDISLLLP